MHVSYTLWEGIFPNSLGMFSTRNKAKLMVHSAVLTKLSFSPRGKMWPDDSLALHPDKSCMFNFMPDENAVTWFTVHAALAPINSTLPAGFPGHYFIMNSAPQFQRTPFIAQFDGDAQDVIMLAYKVSDMRVYAYGIPIDKVITFKPPSGKQRGQEVDEAAILSSYN